MDNWLLLRRQRPKKTVLQVLHFLKSDKHVCHPGKEVRQTLVEDLLGQDVFLLEGGVGVEDGELLLDGLDCLAFQVDVLLLAVAVGEQKKQRWWRCGRAVLQELGDKGAVPLEPVGSAVAGQMVLVRGVNFHWNPNVPVRVDVVVGHLAVLELGPRVELEDLLTLGPVPQLLVAVVGRSEQRIEVLGCFHSRDAQGTQLVQGGLVPSPVERLGERHRGEEDEVVDEEEILSMWMARMMETE